MKIVQTDEVPVMGRVPARGGTGHTSQTIFDSDVLGLDPGRPGNFFVQISYVKEGQFSAPRHRHDFEQFRYMISGETEFAEGPMTGGTLGYFPAGAFYGPQVKMEGTIVILQCGGANGAGFVERKQLKATFEEMKSKNLGEFRDGTFYRNAGVEGPPVQDGNEAAFEYLRKRPVVYPRPQYASPILIDSNSFPWSTVTDVSGVEEKALGTFTSAKIRTARYKLDPGATFVATGPGVYLVLSGTGQVGDEPFRQYTALYLADGEEVPFVANQTSDILLLGLPNMGLIADRPPTTEH